MIGKWPGCCTSTGQDASKEIDLGWIGPVVAEFRRPQDSRSPYHAHGNAPYAHMAKWPRCCTSKGQDSSNELDLEWIGPVVTELQRPQSLGRTNGRTDERMDGEQSPFFFGKGGGQNGAPCAQKHSNDRIQVWAGTWNIYIIKCPGVT